MIQDALTAKNMPYVWFLLPRGLLCSFIRGLVEMRLGHVNNAVTEFESLIGSIEEDIEEQHRKKLESKNAIFVLDNIYSLLARLYLEAGQLDEVFLLVVRVKKNIGRDYLKGLPELNIKNAQLLKAALRAGKLIDEAGFATLFLQTGQQGDSSKGSDKLRLKNELLKRKRLKNHKISKTEEVTPQLETPSNRGKVIQFPLH